MSAPVGAVTHPVVPSPAMFFAAAVSACSFCGEAVTGTVPFAATFEPDVDAVPPDVEADPPDPEEPEPEPPDPFLFESGWGDELGAGAGAGGGEGEGSTEPVGSGVIVGSALGAESLAEAAEMNVTSVSNPVAATPSRRRRRLLRVDRFTCLFPGPSSSVPSPRNLEGAARLGIPRRPRLESLLMRKSGESGSSDLRARGAASCARQEMTRRLRRTILDESDVTEAEIMMKAGRLKVAVLLAGILVVALFASTNPALGAPHGSSVSGLPVVSSGPRPGPDILYAPPPRAPQLENKGVWDAAPILVSGTQAYRDGEWMYQDFLFDDHGATGVKDSEDPNGPGTNLFSPSAGTFTYPTDKAYANNAADLVELRVKPLGNATAFRVTLDTLLDPDRTAFTIALGDSDSAVDWPDGAGVSSPAKFFLTWHGAQAAFTDAGTGKAVSPAPTVRVDMLRRQVQLLLPHAAWDPGTSRVRTTIGVGLWDPSSGAYLAPQPGAATETTPGGGTPNGVAIVNVGPRLDEPMPIFCCTNFVDSAAVGEVNARFWRERQQSQQLTLGDVSPFSVDVDFSKLAAKVTDDSGVPTSGPMDRIFASHFSSGQGVRPENVCFDLGANFAAGAKCIGREVGQLQPYALYVPKKPVPAQGWGLTLLLHSLSVNYNQYLASRNQSELGDRGPGSLVLTPEGRGPDGFYAGVPEADTFEAWADVARHYPIDQSWTAVSGYSMGGFGTYRLLARWPDLFARGFSVVGAPGSVDDQLISIRNDPLLLWNATADELVNINTSEQAVADDTAAGLQFEEDLFLTADHLTLAGNDEFTPGAEFLGTATVDRDPARVSYVVDPTEDSDSVVADHVYWISGLHTRDKGDGTLEVLSKGFGQGVPEVKPVEQGGGALTGGEIPALAYVSRSQPWDKAPATTPADELVITAKNLAAMTIDVRRAHVTCGVKLTVDTDGPLSIVLGGCGRTLRFG